VAIVGVLIFLVIFLPPPSTLVAFCCIFAPFGTVIRWQLSRWNPKFPTFPIATFGVNVVGSLLVGIFSISKLYTDPSSIGFSILGAMVTGFCGCLTTVSTFENECRLLNLSNSWRYASCSVIGAQILLLILNGPYYW